MALPKTMIDFFKIEAAGIKEAPFVSDYSISSDSGKRFCSSLDTAITLRDAELANRTMAEMSAIACKASTHGGTLWTDVLTPTQSHHPLLFSENVVRTLESEHIKGWYAIPVEIASIRGIISKSTAMKYYQVYPQGKPLEFNHRVFEHVGGTYEFRFETNDKTDPRLRPTALPYVQQIQRVPLLESWDKSDIIMASSANPTFSSGGFFCSRRFVDLAKREGWRNLSITPIDRLGKCIGDFLEHPWPPEKWYPENHPSYFISD